MIERLIYPPKPTAWMARANCAGLSDPELFFPARGGPSEDAKAICRECRVQDACLEYALTAPIEKWGIWGGYSERERQRIRARRRRSA